MRWNGNSEPGTTPDEAVAMGAALEAVARKDAKERQKAQTERLFR